MLNISLLSRATADDPVFREMLLEKIQIKCDKFNRELRFAIQTLSFEMAHRTLSEFYRTSSPYLDRGFSTFLKETISLPPTSGSFIEASQTILTKMIRQEAVLSDGNLLQMAS